MIASVVVILLLMVGIGQFSTEPQEKAPCSEPLTFRVGNIDKRFSIHREELIGMLKEVAEDWSEAASMPVVQYDEDGEIPVNLVYAEEQQLSDRERQHRERLEQEESGIVDLENEYARLNQEYNEDVEQYDEDSGELQESIDRLNEWVVQKNNDGGFNESDLKRFEKRKAEIDQAKRELTRQERTLKRRADELNDRLTFINQKVKEKNRLVDEYNRQYAGERKFTQGAYEWMNDSREINIFYFLDKNELRLVIAHETGHALGIDHVSNPKSVMYELMGNQNRQKIELTNEDIQALQQVCTNQLN